MADQDDMYLENLDELVNDENKIVSLSSNSFKRLEIYTSEK